MNFEQGVIGMLEGQEDELHGLQRRAKQIVTPGMYLSDFLALPGLVGFWPMSSVQRSTGNVYDLSGQGRTLTYNGNPVFNYATGGGLAFPFLALDGTGDYLSRADETDLDILGSETLYDGSVRGLTLYIWFRPDVGAGGATHILAGKLLAATQFSYWIAFRDTNKLSFLASADGTTVPVDASSAADISVGTWHLGVGRYIPSFSGVVWLDGIPAADEVGIPASLFNGTAPFVIGATGTPGNYFQGAVAIIALYSQAHPTAWIDWLWTRGRALFGV